MPPSPCARGCCWSPFSCAKNHECACHPPTLTEWLGVKTTTEPPATRTHRDPTGETAIRNIMREQRKGRT